MLAEEVENPITEDLENLLLSAADDRRLTQLKLILNDLESVTQTLQGMPYFGSIFFIFIENIVVDLVRRCHTC
jgi:hypothetical protein